MINKLRNYIGAKEKLVALLKSVKSVNKKKFILQLLLADKNSDGFYRKEEFELIFQGFKADK